MSAAGGLRRLALALAGAAVGLALAEGAARLLTAPPRTHDASLELDGTTGFRGVPGTREEHRDEAGAFSFALGPEGFRGRPLPEEPGAGQRVVFLGDSFLVGRGLREEALLPARVERALRAADPAAEAYNLSVIDTGTGQQLLLLARYGERLAADAVVLLHYPANDLTNDTRALAGRSAASPGDAVRPYVYGEAGRLRRDWVHPVRGPLRSRSRLFALFERALLGYAVPGAPAPASMTRRIRSGGLPLEELEVFRRHDPGSLWEQGWRRSFALLRLVQERCDALGARLLVLVVPSEHQVQRGAKVVAWDAAMRLLTRRKLSERVDWNLPERRLAAFLAESGIEGGLLLTPLREAAAAGQDVYTRDGHLSAAGHALASAPVLAWLAGEAAAPPQPPRGRPVPRLPQADAAPALLDLSADRHAAFLGDGWLDWRRGDPERPGGWQLGSRALLVLPDRAGDLLIEGQASGDGGATALRVERVGSEAQRFQVVGGLPFALRMTLDGSPTGARVDGYAVFLLEPGAAGSALRVARIGLVPPLPPREAGGPGQ